MATDNNQKNPEDNLDLWERVKKTDPSYTKKASNGRFSFTTVDPQYQLLEATRVFGPYGSTWGLRNLQIEPIESDGMTTMMLIADFWYTRNGKEHSFPIAVDQKFRTGFDTVKILMTSARSKALSYLGFAADVFMGGYDDAEYVKNLKVEFGDRDQFKKTALGMIRMSDTEEKLVRCEERVRDMAADKTIDLGVATELQQAINEQRGAISQ